MTYCSVYGPLSIEHRGSALGVIRRNISLDCCLCSCRTCSVYVGMSKIDRCKELKPTCSSSTLAANGKASEARTMMVERTMEDEEPIEAGG